MYYGIFVLDIQNILATNAVFPTLIDLSTSIYINSNMYSLRMSISGKYLIMGQRSEGMIIYDISNRRALVPF